jgi:WhiB family transcriptional regulator, redox-sensing transcriptional regulator
VTTVPEGVVMIERGSAGRPAATEWRAARTQPWGPWRTSREWMRRGACTAPEVDPNWFTVDEDAPGAAEQIAQAKAVCRHCPVRLLCRVHADETGEYGVYNAETYSERTHRLRRWRRLELPA